MPYADNAARLLGVVFRIAPFERTVFQMIQHAAQRLDKDRHTTPPGCLVVFRIAPFERTVFQMIQHAAQRLDKDRTNAKGFGIKASSLIC